MDMQWIYGVELRREGDGRVHAYASAMPDANASGADDGEALAEMAQALDAAVRGRMTFGLDLEAPPEAAWGPGTFEEVRTIALAAELAAKASVYALWRASGLSKVALAAKLDVNEKEARRVLDPDHATALGRLAAAAEAFGHRLVIKVEPDHVAQVAQRLRSQGLDPDSAPVSDIKRADINTTLDRIVGKQRTRFGDKV